VGQDDEPCRHHVELNSHGESSISASNDDVLEEGDIWTVESTFVEIEANVSTQASDMIVKTEDGYEILSYMDEEENGIGMWI